MITLRVLNHNLSKSSEGFKDVQTFLRMILNLMKMILAKDGKQEGEEDQDVARMTATIAWTIYQSTLMIESTEDPVETQEIGMKSQEERGIKHEIGTSQLKFKEHQEEKEQRRERTTLRKTA